MAAAHGSETPQVALPADVHRPHARVLEEEPTSEAGAPIDVRAALHLLHSGQLVNCTIGVPADVAPAMGIRCGAEMAMELAALVGLPIHARPLVLIADSSPERRGAHAAAGEVLATNVDRRELVLGVDEVPASVVPGMAVVVDFTDVSGTYYVGGVVNSVRIDRYPHIGISARLAAIVQLRRFVRVPVLIAPQALEVHENGDWRPVGGRIVDLSLGGLGLLVDEPLPEHARLRLTFDLPGQFGSMAVTGRVVQPPGLAEAHLARRSGDSSCRRGCSFDPLTVEDLRRLQRALYRRQVELRQLTDPWHGRRPARHAAGPARPERRPRPRWAFWGTGA